MEELIPASSAKKFVICGLLQYLKNSSVKFFKWPLTSFKNFLCNCRINGHCQWEDSEEKLRKNRINGKDFFSELPTSPTKFVCHGLYNHLKSTVSRCFGSLTYFADIYTDIRFAKYLFDNCQYGYGYYSIGVMVFSYIVTCLYILNIMGSSFMRGIFYPFFHAKSIFMNILGLEIQEDKQDNAIFAHNVKFLESMVESYFQLNMSFVLVKNYGIVGELQLHSLVLSTFSIVSNFARRYAYTESNQEPSLFSGHYWSSMAYFLPCWVMVFGLTVFHCSNKYLSPTSFWCLQIPAFLMIVYGMVGVQVLGSETFQCLEVNILKRIYSVMRKAHLLSVLALFYHLAIFAMYIIDWNYIPEENVFVQNEFYVCDFTVDKRNSSRKNIIEWEGTNRWPYFLWLFGLPVICQLCMEYCKIWKGKQKFVFNMGHFFEGPLIHDSGDDPI